MVRIFISIFMCLFVSLGFAKSMPQPLQPDQAFQFSSFIDQKDQVTLEWRMAPGYYLYKSQLQIKVDPSSTVKINKIALPMGITKKDDIHGIYQAYAGTLKLPISVIPPADGVLNVSVNYQGCSMSGFCYAPVKKDLHLHFKPGNGAKNIIVTGVMQQEPVESDQSAAQKIFGGSSDVAIIFSFLGLGLLLAFTPCVLPMVPILSGIILGHKHLTTTKAFFLSLVYVLGMAITYALAGIVVALIGSRIQTFFQSTWVIVIFSGLFVLLALSLFGFYELALPAHWQQRITALSNRQKGGTYLGVFLMGALSSLIVSPCVSAPLVGVLAYIAQSGDIVLGGFALLALGLGMGLPLILLGISAGKLLPKAGSWMLTIERMFGIFLLAFAIWMLSRVIPGPLALLLWAILLICSAMYMGVFSEAKTNWKKLLRGLGLVLLVYGIILIIGAVIGNSDPLRPLEGAKIVKNRAALFVVPKTMTELDQQLAAAKAAHKPVILDFYADWCVSCVAMERHVFNQPETRQLLSNFVVLRADVTQNDDFDHDEMKRFNVVAPPTILFFDADGQELKADSSVGEQTEKQFLDHVQQLGLI